MKTDILAAVVAAALGVAVALVNYLLSKKVLLSSPDKYSLITVLRQVVQIGYLVLVYFVGEEAGFDLVYLLVGAVLGMTVPMLYFTKKLLSLNNGLAVKKKGEEEKSDG